MRSLLVRDVLLVAGLVALALALYLAAFDWPNLHGRLQDSLTLAFAALALAGLAAWRLRIRAATAVLIICLPLAGVMSLGLAGAIATTLLVLGAGAIGSVLPRVAGTSPLLRLVAGLGLLAGIAGWLLPFPLHYGWTWILALAALVVWRRRPLRDDLAELKREFQSAVALHPGIALVVTVLAFVSAAPAWLPIRMADDVAYHLGLGWQLMEFGHARFDVGTQVWALAPWSTDVLHAMVMVMAGHEVTGFLNIAWLLAAAWLIRGLAESLGLAPRLAWWTTAAYLTLPMTYMLAGSMQVESATPAIFLAIASLLVARPASSRAPLLLLAVLAGALLGTKVSNGLLLLPFFAWWLAQWRLALPWRDLPMAIALGLLAGGSSYAYAAWLTGNPVLPLMNGYFLSPWYLPENFLDRTWTQGLSWDLPWQWVTNPRRFHEGGSAGTSGVVVLALLGGAACALFDRRSRPLALATLAACVLLLSQIQYLRYLHPLMPMLLVVMVSGLAAPAPRGRDWVLAGLVAVQFVLLPTAAWQLMARNLRVLAKQGPTAVLQNLVPERVLAAHFRQVAEPGDFLLFAHSSNTAIAELPGRAAAVSWHSNYVWKVFLESRDWPAMLDASGATHVVYRNRDAEPAMLEALVARGAEPVISAGSATLVRLDPADVPVATRQAEDGSLHAVLSLDAGHAVTGWLQADVQCSHAGEVLALQWTLDRPGRAPQRHWAQEACDHDARAQVKGYYTSLANPGNLQVRISSLPGKASGQIALTSATALRRRDPLADAERFHVVWDALCARPGCARDRNKVFLDRWQAPRR